MGKNSLPPSNSPPNSASSSTTSFYSFSSISSTLSSPDPNNIVVQQSPSPEGSWGNPIDVDSYLPETSTSAVQLDTPIPAHGILLGRPTTQLICPWCQDATHTYTICLWHGAPHWVSPYHTMVIYHNDISSLGVSTVSRGLSHRIFLSPLWLSNTIPRPSWTFYYILISFILFWVLCSILSTLSTLLPTISFSSIPISLLNSLFLPICSPLLSVVHFWPSSQLDSFKCFSLLNYHI